MLALLLFAVLASPSARAADPTTPHPHTLVHAVRQAPAALVLSAEEQDQLAAGRVVVRSHRSELGGRGEAVQLVAAPPETIWAAILDYPRYPERVGSVESAVVYERQGDVFFVDMKSSVVGVETVIYSRNELHRDEGWMAWGLDRRRTSDVKDIAGYWRVEAVSADPPLSRLEHATELAISGVPGFVVKYLTGKALVDGVAWVKTAAEGS